MNYLVHCVMYFYYFLSALGYRPVWAPVVTVMQISQMFVGVAMCVLVYRYSKDGGSCAVSHANYIAGLLMYVVRDMRYRHAWPTKLSTLLACLAMLTPCPV